MAGAALSIKLRCASWQQLATIYKRDLSRGTMFLKASTQPPIGTLVRIDLELPSATIIELQGTITKHVVDPQRGTGVDLALEPLPTKSVWMIESALAAESKVRAEKPAASPGAVAAAEPERNLEEGSDVAAAEAELMKALDAEAESLKKLNPFLVLGVGYETNDEAVRAAFGELTKRYHPDRFARYQSQKLRQTAAEIFIVIRDAYRKLADPSSRQQLLATLGQRVPPKPPPPPGIPSGPRTTGQVPTMPAPKSVPPSPPLPRIAVPPVPPPSANAAITARTPAPAMQPHDAPTNQSAKSAELAGTELAKPEELIPTAVPRATATPPGGVARPVADAKSGPVRIPPTMSTPPGGVPSRRHSGQNPSLTIPLAPGAGSEASEAAGIETLIDQGKLDDALVGYRMLAKKNPQERVYRANIELVEGLKSLNARERMEAAERFEMALEIDPSNERAARELAEMRRQATNERKGLLSRLMGKKEPGQP